MTCRKSVVWIIIWWKGVECCRRSIHGYDVTMWAVNFKIDVICLIYVFIFWSKYDAKIHYFCKLLGFLFIEKVVSCWSIWFWPRLRNKIFPKCRWKSDFSLNTKHKKNLRYKTIVNQEGICRANWVLIVTRHSNYF